MPYSEALEQRIDAAIDRWKHFSKKKMFGGVGYLLNGTMCFGIYQDYLIVRLDKAEAAARLEERDTRPFDITGTPMKGWVMVAAPGYKTAATLKKWLELAKVYVKNLPKK